MKIKLETRLKELKEEYQKGQKQLLALDQESTALSNTILRISGAIQVIEEILDEKSSESPLPVNNGSETVKNVEK